MQKPVLVVLVVAVALLVTPVADARCPTPGTYYCNAYCTSYYCHYNGDPCSLCTENFGGAGCASWSSCSCCEQFGLF